MALKSDQARVLRRRVLGGTARNLVLFTAVYLVLCLILETTVVPRISDEVADATSVWRPLNSTESFDQAMVESGLLGTDLFAEAAASMEKEGFSPDAGSITEVTGELDAISQAVEAYTAAVAAGTPAEEAAHTVLNDYLQGTVLYGVIDAGLADSVEADGETTDAEAKSADEGDAAIAIVTGNDDNAAYDGAPSEAEGAPESAQPVTPVPFITYDAILAAQGINPSDASAAEGFAALQVSASIQELGLSLTMPPGIDTDPVAILTNAALLGMDNTLIYDILDEAYPASQTEAYNQWALLAPAEQARLVGLSAADPVWQVERNAQGTYEVRDIATYAFVKSFKLPLAFLLFVVGWLVIIFRALSRSLRYFDELSVAVGKVIGDKNAPIDLPPDLSIARNELAVIRSQSLADERAAKAAEQRKNELVAYLAHDIRTPLTSVLGYLDLLRETCDLPRDTLRKYADIAYTKAERLETLINEFFEITRYNLSAIPIERETVGVRLFCQQVAESFFPEASARGIRISVDVGAADQFFVDPDKLARALGNVMRNAVAYADANSVIALTARQSAGFTIITVANRGREISPAHLASIFEKFYREDGARTTRSGGAGLGLAIAKEIVVAHQGDIEAASQRGVTVFTLRLPTRAPGEPGTEPTPPRSLRAPAATAAATAAIPPVGATSQSPSATAETAPYRRDLPTPPTAPASPRRGGTTARNDGERPGARPQSAPPLKPCNARHGRAAGTATVRDNRPRPKPNSQGGNLEPHSHRHPRLRQPRTRR